MTSLRIKIINVLNTLQETDRDLKTITIILNTNYINGSDIELQKIIKKEIDIMVYRGVIRKNKISIDVLIGRNGNYKHVRKMFTIYSLNKTKF